MLRLTVIICLILTSLGSVVQAQLVVEITEGIKRRPVAIVPFGWEGNGPAAPTDVSGIISDDLSRSGRFAPIAEGDMLQKPTDGVDDRLVHGWIRAMAAKTARRNSEGAS